MEKSNVKFVPVVLVIVVLAVIWYADHADSGRQQDEMPELFESTATTGPETAADGKIYVHIVGAVKKPGVYSFDSPPRLIEVVEQAGGFTKDAVRSGVNQAQIVEDGSQIVIESGDGKKRQAEAGQEQAGAQQPAQGQSSDRININKASKEELMTLPGIGESKADAIISYRDTNGAFKKIEDIMNITGIKTGVFDKIKDRIDV